MDRDGGGDFVACVDCTEKGEGGVFCDDGMGDGGVCGCRGIYAGAGRGRMAGVCFLCGIVPADVGFEQFIRCIAV